jgi:hypothetical protein
MWFPCKMTNKAIEMPAQTLMLLFTMSVFILGDSTVVDLQISLPIPDSLNFGLSVDSGHDARSHLGPTPSANTTIQNGLCLDYFSHKIFPCN